MSRAQASGGLKNFDDLNMYELAKQGPAGVPTSALQVPLVNFDIVIHNQKHIAASIARIPSLLGPPASQNEDLARVIIELDEQRKKMEVNAQAMSEKCRSSLELSQSVQPVLDELVKLRAEVKDLKQDMNNKCCTIS